MVAEVRAMQLALVLPIAQVRYVAVMVAEAAVVPVALGHAPMEPVFLLVVVILLARVLPIVGLAIYVLAHGREGVLLARHVLMAHVFLPVPRIVTVEFVETMVAAVAVVRAKMGQIVLTVCAFLHPLHAQLIKIVLLLMDALD